MARYDNLVFPVIAAASCSFDAGRVYWETPDNFVVNLDDSTNFQLLEGRSGYIAPPYSYISSRVPAEHGERLRRVHIDKRTVDVPLYLMASSYGGLLRLQRDLMMMLDSATYEEESRLYFVDEDDNYRYLNCVYSGGFIGKQTSNSEFITWCKVVLSFDAFDPFFYAATEQTEVLALSATSGSFTPFLPMVVSSAIVNETLNIENDGFDTFPVWTLTGPFNSARFTNNTTGKELYLDYSAAEGETITVNTRTGEKAITSSIAGNLYPALSTVPSFWELKSGINSITVELSDVNANSSAELRYRLRYLVM